MIAFKWMLALLVAAATVPAAAAPRDVQTEEANRALVVNFYERIFNQHQVEDGVKSMADDYRQHNPMINSGKQAFVSFFTDLYRKNPEAKARILRVAADGDLVWIHAHHTLNQNDPGMLIVDIFRVDGGKIAEHWDVIQKYPENAVNPLL